MRLLAFLCLCSFFPGCTFRCTTRPGAAGRVIDHHTARPIRGATVTLGRPDNTITAQTLADGTFSLSPQNKWGLFSTFDAFPRKFPLSVQREGYSKYRAEIESNPAGDKPARKPLGSISLRPL